MSSQSAQNGATFVVDGELVEAPCLHPDASLSRGAGALEVFRACGGRGHLLSRHLARAQRSCRALGVPDFDPEAAQEDLRILDGCFPGVPLRVRAIFGTSADGAPLRVISGRPIVGDSSRPESPAVACVMEGRVTAAPPHKTTSYAGSIVMQQRAKSAGFDACILHESGDLMEAASANLFLVIANCLVTPNSPYMLPGITRGRLLELSSIAGIETEVRKVSTEELVDADAAFLTSSVRGVMPLKSVRTETDLVTYAHDHALVKRAHALIEADVARTFGPG